MRIAGSIVTLVCGIVALVGVFLPWASAFPVSVSGWDGISGAGISGAPEPFLVLIGGILMAVFCLPAFIVSVATRGGRAAVLTLGIFATLASLLVIGGAAWWIVEVAIDPTLGIGVVGYGAYMSVAAGVLGLTFGIVTTATS